MKNDDYLPGLFSSIKNVLIISFIVAIIMLAYFSIDFVHNKFVITINNQEIVARMDVEYKKFIFKDYQEEGLNKSISNESEIINYIKRDNNIILKINEYEVYNKYNVREDYSYLELNTYKYKPVNTKNKTMLIQKDNKTIYEGGFKEDITDLIKENGRYYIHVYNKSKGDTFLFSYVKTNLHFIINIGDENE